MDGLVVGDAVLDLLAADGLGVVGDGLADLVGELLGGLAIEVGQRVGDLAELGGAALRHGGALLGAFDAGPAQQEREGPAAQGLVGGLLGGQDRLAARAVGVGELQPCAIVGTITLVTLLDVGHRGFHLVRSCIFFNYDGSRIYSSVIRDARKAVARNHFFDLVIVRAFIPSAIRNGREREVVVRTIGNIGGIRNRIRITAVNGFPVSIDLRDREAEFPALHSTSGQLLGAAEGHFGISHIYISKRDCLDEAAVRIGNQLAIVAHNDIEYDVVLVHVVGDAAEAALGFLDLIGICPRLCKGDRAEGLDVLARLVDIALADGNGARSERRSTADRGNREREGVVVAPRAAIERLLYLDFALGVIILRRAILEDGCNVCAIAVGRDVVFDNGFQLLLGTYACYFRYRYRNVMDSRVVGNAVLCRMIGINAIGQLL